MADDLCKHDMLPGSCSACKAPAGPAAKKVPAAVRSSGAREWEQYRERYGKRPETFEAYVDVWNRFASARAAFGGWSTFSRAANAEPAMPPEQVRRAEELMRLGGYEAGPKLQRAGRRWFRST